MHLNANTALISPHILLVPYEAHQVPQYHRWMEDAELREATASERLTLAEEYGMQKAWREDTDKLTFLVCLPPPSTRGSSSLPQEAITAGVEDTDQFLVGDINLFLYPSNDDNGEDETALEGEIELMIATKQNQGKGLGRAATLLFLWYVLVHHDEIVNQKKDARRRRKKLEKLRVKINQGNERSIGLFASLGFAKTQEKPNYFGEVEMELRDLRVERVEEMVNGGGWREWREVRYRHGDI